MPIYEYQCKDCGKVFETFQKITEPPLKECRICKGTVERLISNCSFHLKGTGWYVTDYKRGGATSSGNGSKSAEKTETETETETKTETKTETSASTPSAASGGTSEKG
jgi:putative FmdB family regulatory protein